MAARNMRHSFRNVKTTPRRSTMNTPTLEYRANGEFKGATGREAVDIYAAAVIASGIGLYVKTGGRMRASRNYTPPNMLAKATEITGQKFKGRNNLEKLAAAETALRLWITEAKTKVLHVQDEPFGEPRGAGSPGWVRP
jgi:hypothetical protein